MKKSNKINEYNLNELNESDVVDINKIDQNFKILAEEIKNLNDIILSFNVQK